jgi:hypothetical protein
MAPGEDERRRMLGGFIRAQRQTANLSLRQLSALTEVSNPYLSQVDRGLHEPFRTRAQIDCRRVERDRGDAVRISRCQDGWPSDSSPMT